MSLLKFIKAQLGLSTTPTNNFTLDASAQDGSLKLSRGNAGATTQDVLVVDAAGKVSAPAGFLGFAFSISEGMTGSSYVKFPAWCFGGLIVQWGLLDIQASPADNYTINMPVTFTSFQYRVLLSLDADNFTAGAERTPRARRVGNSTFEANWGGQIGTSGGVWLAIGK